MILNLTDMSDEPLQGQIERQVRAKILSGEFKADAALPSIRGLAKTHKVSVITVQRAYEALLRENLIHSRRGKGFFVSKINRQNKKDLARQRLYQNLERPVQAALAEGLSMGEIRKVIDEIARHHPLHS